MNIKIPYESLGNFNDVEFISIILDKESKSIYRQDLNKSENQKIWNRIQEYVIVPDDPFVKCDHVVFYPYSSKKGWLNKVQLKQDQIAFSKKNGGVEFVKNSNKEGSRELVNEWISIGKNITPSENVIGNKNLIYFTIFNNNEYIKLFNLLLDGLLEQEYKNFDLLIITDNPTKKKLKSLKILSKFNVDYMVLKTIKDPVVASMQKIKIFDYKKINEYSKILFLDVDILVVGNVETIFGAKIRPNIIYSGIQKCTHTIHNTVYHSLIEYTREELQYFEKFDIFPFNAGQFLFVNTESIKKHFENINKFVKSWKSKFFFEQSFINHYFNTLGMSNIFKFHDNFQFVSINMDEFQKSLHPDSVFLHFMGNATDGKGKLDFIKKHYNHLLIKK